MRKCKRINSFISYMMIFCMMLFFFNDYSVAYALENDSNVTSIDQNETEVYVSEPDVNSQEVENAIETGTTVISSEEEPSGDLGSNESGDSAGETETDEAGDEIESILISEDVCDYYGLVGEKALFRIEVNNQEAVFQWYYSKDNGSSWQKCFYDGFNTNELNFEINSYQYNYLFMCEVSSDMETINSSVVCLHEKDTTISLQPQDCMANIGDKVSFGVEASGNNLSYRWYYSSDGGENWQKCYSYYVYNEDGSRVKTSYEGYGTSTISFQTTRSNSAYLYRCEVSDRNKNITISDSAKINLKGISISSQPANNNLYIGDTTNFEVNATGNELKYQWFYSKDNGETWIGCGYTGSKTNNLAFTVKQYQYGFLFKCCVSDLNGNKEYTDIVSLNEKEAVITQQPVEVVASVGESVSFSTAAIGNGVSYRWYYSNDGGSNWYKCYYYSGVSDTGEKIKMDYVGYNTSTIGMVASPSNYNYVYRCEIIDKIGTIIESETVKIIPGPPTILTQPNVCYLGNGVNISFRAMGAYLTYCWYSSNDGGKTWSKSYLNGYKTNCLSLGASDISEDMLYRCMITDRYGASVYTNEVSILSSKNKVIFNPDDYLYSTLGNVSTTERVNNDTFLHSVSMAETDYSTILNFAISETASANETFVLCFSAYTEKQNRNISISINENAKKLDTVLTTEVSDYIIPINGIESIGNVCFEIFADNENIHFDNISVRTVSATDIANIKFGIFNCDAKESTIDVSSGVGYMATDSISDGNYLYTIYSGMLTVYSLENKAMPKIVGFLDGLGDTRELAFCNDGNTLAVSSRENGVFLVDISTPNSPYIVSNIETLNFATGIYVYDHFCFVASRRHGVEIFDIENVSYPTYVTQVFDENEEFYDCFVYDGYLYVTSWAERRVHVYDVRNIYSPVEVSTISLDGKAAGCYVESGYLYVATGYNNANSARDKYDIGTGMGNGMEIYDVSNPEDPKWCSTTKIDGRYSISGFDHWRVYVSNGKAYLVNAYSGIYIYDVTDPYAPKRNDKYIINIPTDSAKYKVISGEKYVFPYNQSEHGQALMTSVCIGDGYFYATCHGGDRYKGSTSSRALSGNRVGLYYFEYTDAVTEVKTDGKLDETRIVTEKPEYLFDGFSAYYTDTSVMVHKVVEKNGIYYCATSESGIMLIDYENDSVSYTPTEMPVKDLIIKDNYLFAAETNSGLAVYRILEEGGKLVLINRYKCNLGKETCTDIELFSDGNKIIAQYGWNYYAVLDISDPTNIVFDEINESGLMYSKSISSQPNNAGWMVVSDRSYLSLYKPVSEGKADRVSFSNTRYNEEGGVTGYQDYFIQLYGGGYIYYNPDTLSQAALNSSSVIKVPGVTLIGTPYVFGNTLVVPYSGGRMITFVDISDLNNPTLLGQYYVDGNPEIIYCSDNEIWLGMGHKGFLRLIQD